MKKHILLLFMLLLLLLGTVCGSSPEQNATVPEPPDKAPIPSANPAEAELKERDDAPEGTAMDKKLNLTIADAVLSVIWEENDSVEALMALVSSGPLTVQLSMYGGFEQVGSLGIFLPRNDSQMTTQTGDVVLYAGNQIVVFYDSNSWTYTRLGRITDCSAAELQELLGNGDVTITLSLD